MGCGKYLVAADEMLERIELPGKKFNGTMQEVAAGLIATSQSDGKNG